MTVCCWPDCDSFRCYFWCCVKLLICFFNVNFVAQYDLIWILVSYVVNEVNESE